MAAQIDYPSNGTLINIFLVNGCRIMLEGMKSLLADNSRFKVIGCASNARGALKKVDDHVNLIFLDFELDGMDGCELAHTINKLYPHIRIIALSRITNKARINSVLEAGCLGYIAEDAAEYYFNEAIATVMKGEKYLCVEAKDVLEQDTGSDNQIHRLTPREHKVFELIAIGNKNSKIADELGISIRTVEGHRNRLMNKLKINSVSDLTRLAIQNDIIKV